MFCFWLLNFVFDVWSFSLQSLSLQHGLCLCCFLTRCNYATLVLSLRLTRATPAPNWLAVYQFRRAVDWTRIISLAILVGGKARLLKESDYDSLKWMSPLFAFPICRSMGKLKFIELLAWHIFALHCTEFSTGMYQSGSVGLNARLISSFGTWGALRRAQAKPRGFTYLGNKSNWRMDGNELGKLWTEHGLWLIFMCA